MINDLEEDEIHEVLRCIRQQHDNAAAPWLERLAALQAMRCSPEFFVTEEQAALLLDYMPNDQAHTHRAGLSD